MIGRLIVGGLIGGIIGAALSVLLIKLGLASLPLILFYAVAAGAGALTGLFAGKPIWASGGKIEAGLKAVFGALLAVGALFAIRKWLSLDVDLSRFGAGAGPIGELPAASLPMIAATLGALFGLDNTPDGASAGTSDGKASAKARSMEGGSAKARVAKGGAGISDDEAEDDASAGRRARR